MAFVPENFKDKSVCIMGMGYVGLTLATVMADVGFKVIGIEIRDDILAGLKEAKPHFYEPGLLEHLERLVKEEKICFYKRIPNKCKASVYIIAVGTPLGPNCKARMDMIESVSCEVSNHLKNGDIVIMRSTVKIGTTRKLVKPILDKMGLAYDLAFCPERTLEGAALIELRNLPQIVGGLDSKSFVRAAQIFQFIASTIVRVNDLETAEMIKLVNNAQRDVSFAYANEIARICDAVGISASEVIRAGNLGYPRTNLPMPGLVGGPCLEKDSYVLIEGLKELGLEPEITAIARHINKRQPEEVVSFLKKITRDIKDFPKDPVISLMGIAFKGNPPTDDLRGTMARPVLSLLREHFSSASFRGYDNFVSPEKLAEFGLDPCASIEKAMTGAHLVFIVNNSAEFSSMPIEKLANYMARPGLIYDFWNNFNARDLHLPKGIGYMSLGSHGCGVLPNGV